MAIFYKHKTSPMLLCKGLVFVLYLFFVLLYSFVCSLVYLNLLFYACSFFWLSKRTNQENSRGWQNLRILLLKQKIRTRHTETNKNFHWTRFAQTPGNFYCFLVNTAKFLMPRFVRYRTFNVMIRQNCVTYEIAKQKCDWYYL